MNDFQERETGQSDSTVQEASCVGPPQAARDLARLLVGELARVRRGLDVGGVVEWPGLPPHRVDVEDAVRKEIVGIGSLVEMEQSWCVVYEWGGHVVVFPRRDLPHSEDAERLVREYLAMCQECAQPLSPAPMENLVSESVRDFWLAQQTERWQ